MVIFHFLSTDTDHYPLVTATVAKELFSPKKRVEAGETLSILSFVASARYSCTMQSWRHCPPSLRSKFHLCLPNPHPSSHRVECSLLSATFLLDPIKCNNLEAFGRGEGNPVVYRQWSPNMSEPNWVKLRDCSQQNILTVTMLEGNVLMITRSYNASKNECPNGLVVLLLCVHIQDTLNLADICMFQFLESLLVAEAIL